METSTMQAAVDEMETNEEDLQYLMEFIKI